MSGPKSRKLKQGLKFGCWTLRQPLDTGGNSYVWIATGKNNEEVAIKIPKLSSGPKKRDYTVERFRSEIEALIKLAGVHGVLPIIGHSSLSDADAAWFVMPLATPMSKAIKQDTPLRTVVEAVHEVAATLTHVHSMGMAHRDIKPENLFHLDGTWCIGDFGLVADIGTHPLTLDGNKLGPTFYIAPEMLNNASRHDGKSADVYSLAKLLWKLASGQTYPIPGTLDKSIDALRLSSYTSDKRAIELDGLLELATNFHPERRPSMERFCSELNTWLNPTQKTNGPSDLSALKTRVLQLSGTYQQTFQNSQAFWSRCRQGQLDTLNAFAELFHSVAQRLRGIGFESIKLSNNGLDLHPEFMDAFSKSMPSLVDPIRAETQSRNSRIIKFVMRGEAHSVALTVGVDVCQRTSVTGNLKFPLWEDPVLLTGGFLIDISSPRLKLNTSSVPVFSFGYIFHFDSPSHARSILSLSKDIEEKLPTAVERVCSEYELISSKLRV